MVDRETRTESIDNNKIDTPQVFIRRSVTIAKKSPEAKIVTYQIRACGQRLTKV